MLFLVWVFAAQVICGAHYGGISHELIWALALDVRMTACAWELIVIGNLVGAAFAFITLFKTVAAFPLLLDRNVGARAAVATRRRRW